MTKFQIIRLVVAALMIVGLGYFVTLPTDELAVGPDCEIEGLGNHLSALIQPTAFWRDQLDAVREARAIQERLQAKSGFGADSDTDKITTAIERRMDRLSERAERQSNVSQQAQQARLDRIEWMSKCEGVIAGRLQQ